MLSISPFTKSTCFSMFFPQGTEERKILSSATWCRLGLWDLDCVQAKFTGGRPHGALDTLSFGAFCWPPVDLIMYFATSLAKVLQDMLITGRLSRNTDITSLDYVTRTLTVLAHDVTRTLKVLARTSASTLTVLRRLDNGLSLWFYRLAEW